MEKGTPPRMKLWPAMILSVIIWLAAAAVNRDLAVSSEETYKGLKLFSDVVELIEKNYVDSVDAKELIEDAIQGMVHGLDPHSSLLAPEAFKELQVDTQGEFTGIGISITMRDGFITVISPIEGTPARRAGIQAGDRIVKVNDKAVKDLREAVRKIRGPKGTEVTVTIHRKGTPDPISFTLIRDVIPIESVRTVVIRPGFAYIWITNFRDSTTEDLEEALDKLESDDPPLKGLILDLRDNPGGLLNQAVSVSDMFLDKGKILSIKGRLKKNTKVFKAHPNGKKHDYPMVVLINGGSASASEIVAGALQDHKRALILGTTSFGKGSVQNVETLREGYGLKLTIARYFTPNGRSIQAKGIEPDIVVKFDPKQVDEEPEKDKKRLKEKDLTNHLDPESDSPEKEPEQSKDNSDSSSSPSQESMPSRQGELNAERLKSDNQVMRALDILISFNVLKG